VSVGWKTVSVKVPAELHERLQKIPSETRNELLRLFVEALATINNAKAIGEALFTVFSEARFRFDVKFKASDGRNYHVTFNDAFLSVTCLDCSPRRFFIYHSDGSMRMDNISMPDVVKIVLEAVIKTM